MYVCMYVCKYVCMYVCMYIYMYVYMYICMYGSFIFRLKKLKNALSKRIILNMQKLLWRTNTRQIKSKIRLTMY